MILLKKHRCLYFNKSRFMRTTKSVCAHRLLLAVTSGICVHNTWALTIISNMVVKDRTCALYSSVITVCRTNLETKGVWRQTHLAVILECWTHFIMSSWSDLSFVLSLYGHSNLSDDIMFCLSLPFFAFNLWDSQSDEIL